MNDCWPGLCSRSTLYSFALPGEVWSIAQTRSSTRCRLSDVISDELEHETEIDATASIWRVRMGHNGGPWHDGAPQRARPRAEEEEEGQGGRRTPPRKEEPREEAPLRRVARSVAPQPPERALGCSFGLNLTRCTEPQRRGHQQGESCWPP